MNLRVSTLIGTYCVALALAPAFVRADDESPASATAATGPAPGHSLHGEAFNEGPRQAAYLMDGMPKVHFPITSKSSDAQKFFDQGVGQLHGFWYFEAERSFRQVAALDPECAIAYWGLAMANVNNEKRAKDFIKKAGGLKDKAPKREQMWIDALADLYKDGKGSDQRHRDYVRALEAIVDEFPDDLEAKAFLVFKIWDNNGKGAKISSHTAVDALAKDVIEANPLHPLHHGRIHLWNYEKDKRALDSAAQCGASGPGIAHMWHMSGHTYSSLHRYAEAVWQQEASARVDHAHMMRDRVLPDQIHNYAHNQEWLIRNLSFLGRVREAVDLAKNLVELPRHPKYNTLSTWESSTNNTPGHESALYERRRASTGWGRERLLEVLSRWERWDEIIALSETMYLDPTDYPEEQAQRLRALGRAWFAKGNVCRGEEQIEALEQVLKKQRELRQQAADDAEAKSRKEKLADDKTAKAMADALQAQSRRLTGTENALAELRLLRALAKGEKEKAREQFELAKDLSKDRKAVIEFELGDKEKAGKLAKEAVEGATNQVHVLANYVDLLWRCEKQDEAKKEFESLRTVAANADLDLPVLKRLQPVAKACALEGDWRKPFTMPADFGERPPMESLGPVRWAPQLAPEFTLTSADEKPTSLKNFRGKPVILIFYLGKGCVHCMEQLNAFAPVTKKFGDHGIKLVAISTDTVAGLAETYDKDKKEFPFELLSDTSLQTFKAYRAYDDFEKTPLHGVFLVDGNGLVRWQDISYEPFRETEFLLGESQRLLNLSSKQLTQKRKARPNSVPRRKS